MLSEVSSNVTDTGEHGIPSQLMRPRLLRRDGSGEDRQELLIQCPHERSLHTTLQEAWHGTRHEHAAAVLLQCAARRLECALRRTELNSGADHIGRLRRERRRHRSDEPGAQVDRWLRRGAGRRLLDLAVDGVVERGKRRV